MFTLAGFTFTGKNELTSPPSVTFRRLNCGGVGRGESPVFECWRFDVAKRFFDQVVCLQIGPGGGGLVDRFHR